MTAQLPNKRIIIVCGHYGVGKTNVSLNLAAKFNALGEKVTLVDLDLVNPYFISSEYKDEEYLKGVHVISPKFAGTNVDVPSVPAEINSIFNGQSGRVIIDAGGDDVGATALGTLARSLADTVYEMLYVINRYRALTTEAEEAAKLLKEIEAACRLKATSIINNSHLSGTTEANDIVTSLAFAEKVSELTGLEVSATTAPSKLVTELEGKVQNLLPIEVYVKTPWA